MLHYREMPRLPFQKCSQEWSRLLSIFYHFRSSVKWSKPRLEPTTPKSVLPQIPSEPISGMKYSQFLGPDEAPPNPTLLPGVRTGLDRFYDFQTCKWVEVDNFAFAAEVNHFSDQSDPAIGDDPGSVPGQQLQLHEVLHNPLFKCFLSTY